MQPRLIDTGMDMTRQHEREHLHTAGGARTLVRDTSGRGLIRRVQWYAYVQISLWKSIILCVNKDRMLVLSLGHLSLVPCEDELLVVYVFFPPMVSMVSGVLLTLASFD